MSNSTEELLPLALVRRWSSRRRGRGRKLPERSAAYQANYDRLTQYGNRCDWLKDDKFLRDLEGDSVDTEILDEELRSLQEDEPQTCRGKSVKFLESNPLQIVLCVLVLIDAGVVVAEILLDLHAIRGQYREANDNLHKVLDFIKEAHADELHGYHGNNVGHILELLHGFEYNSSTDLGPDSYGGGSGSGLGSAERDRRDVFSISNMLSLHLSPRLHGALLDELADSPETTSTSSLLHLDGAQQQLLQQQQHLQKQQKDDSDPSTRANIGSTGIYAANGVGGILYSPSENPALSQPIVSSSYIKTAMRLLKENLQLKAEIAKLYKGIRNSLLLETPSPPASSSMEQDDIDKEDLMVYRDLGEVRRRRDTPTNPGGESGNRHVVHRHNHDKANRTRGTGHHQNSNDGDHVNTYASGGGESRENDFNLENYARDNKDLSSKNHGQEDSKSGDQHNAVDTHSSPTSDDGTQHHRPSRINITHYDDYDDEHAHTQAEKLKEIAHILHFCSIGILGIFVAQLFLKLFGMGITEFFKKKMEIFDAVIILASFALDLVFLEGIGGAQGEEAAALLIVFLLWRILRVINGIMVTAKKRQEFRIKLQKRARRRGDKKVELLEEDRALKEKEIAALRELCARRGADEDEIKACKPRRKSKSIVPRMDTSMGLTSVASLSLSLSMSMSGGAFNSIARSNPILNRRDSIQDILPPQRHPRRSSLLSSKPIEILQNHFRGGPGSGHGDRSPRSSGSLFSNKRLSMEKVVEEKEVENGGEELSNKRNTVCDTIQEGSGEANLALLDHPHGGGVVDMTPPISSENRTSAVTFEVENEVDDNKVVPLAFDRASLGTPSPSRSEHSQSNTSMANGPVRRASTSSRHSNKEHDEIIVPVTTQPLPSDVNMHLGDVTMHQQQQPQNEVPVAVTVAVSMTTEPDVSDTLSSSPQTGDFSLRSDISPEHDTVASHLNEVTMHLDDVNTRLDDVATHLTDVITIQDDNDFSSSSDSEESRHMLPSRQSKVSGKRKGHETTRL